MDVSRSTRIRSVMWDQMSLQCPVATESAIWTSLVAVLVASRKLLVTLSTDDISLWLVCTQVGFIELRLELSTLCIYSILVFFALCEADEELWAQSSKQKSLIWPVNYLNWLYRWQVFKALSDISLKELSKKSGQKYRDTDEKTDTLLLTRLLKALSLCNSLTIAWTLYCLEDLGYLITKAFLL